MDCLFCKMVNNEIEKHLIFEDDLVMVILDKYPNSDGHSLIIPKNHYHDLFDLPDEINNHIKKVAKKMIPLLMDKLNANALTCLVNYGESQMIKHYHYHLIPNYNYRKPKLSVEEVYKKITN